jgi:hypothetical protein
MTVLSNVSRSPGDIRNLILQNTKHEYKPQHRDVLYDKDDDDDEDVITGSGWHDDEYMDARSRYHNEEGSESRLVLTAIFFPVLFCDSKH